MWKCNDFVWRRRSVNILKLNELASICAVGGVCWRKFIAFSAAPWPNAALMFYFWSTDSHIYGVVSSRCFPLRDGAGGGGALKGRCEGGGLWQIYFLHVRLAWRHPMIRLSFLSQRSQTGESKKNPTPFSWCNQSLPLGLVLIRGSREEHIPTRCQRAGCVTQQSKASGFPKAGRGVAWRRPLLTVNTSIILQLDWLTDSLEEAWNEGGRPAEGRQLALVPRCARVPGVSS